MLPASRLPSPAWLVGVTVLGLALGLWVTGALIMVDRLYDCTAAADCVVVPGACTHGHPLVVNRRYVDSHLVPGQSTGSACWRARESFASEDAYRAYVDAVRARVACVRSKCWPADEGG